MGVPRDATVIPLSAATTIEISGRSLCLRIIAERRISFAYFSVGRARQEAALRAQANDWPSAPDQDSFPDAVNFSILLEVSRPDWGEPLTLSLDPYTLEFTDNNPEAASALRQALRGSDMADVARRKGYGPVVGRLLWRGTLLVAHARDPVFARQRLPEEDPADIAPELVNPQAALQPVAIDRSGASFYLCRVFPFRSLYEEAVKLDLKPGMLLRHSLVAIGRNGGSLKVHVDQSRHSEIIASARASGMLSAPVPQELLEQDGGVALAGITRTRRRM